VTFNCGYGTTGADVPAPILHAILLLIGDMFTNRDAKISTNIQENQTFSALLSPYRAVVV